MIKPIRCNGCGLILCEDGLVRAPDKVDGQLADVCPRCVTDSLLQDIIEPSNYKTLGGHLHLVNGDCLEALESITDNSVDLILVDLPYGTTQNKWDSVIPLHKLWVHYKRVLKKGGVVALTGQGIFTAHLILSNEEWFKYKLVWEKSKATNFLNAKRQPLRKHEDIVIFAGVGASFYNPQMSDGDPYSKGVRKDSQISSYGKTRPVDNSSKGGRYPTDVVYFKTAESESEKVVWHGTQKPVSLMSYLIETYSPEGGVVLDNTMGSGTTGVACVNSGRQFIGIELSTEFFEIAEGRLRYALGETNSLPPVPKK